MFYMNGNSALRGYEALKDARGRIARARNRWVAQATRAGAYGLPAAEVRA